MEMYLKKPLMVPLDQLWPDPNNPRLAVTDAPGYESAEALFDEEMRGQIFDKLRDDAHTVDDLVAAIVGQGWMPIDNIIVWSHPSDGDRYVVVEGNRRRLALERIRVERLPKERRKLTRMQDKASTYPKNQIADQARIVERLETVVANTESLPVLPIAADSIDDLQEKLPRILAVRHITGAKEWGGYAEDLYLLQRYNHLFEDQHPEASFSWEDALVQRIADEASLTITKAKRKVKAASWFSHFRAEWEEEPPDGEELTGGTTTSLSRSPASHGYGGSSASTTMPSRCRMRLRRRSSSGSSSSRGDATPARTRTRSSGTRTSRSGIRWRSTTRLTARRSRCASTSRTLAKPQRCARSRRPT